MKIIRRLQLASGFILVCALMACRATREESSKPSELKQHQETSQVSTTHSTLNLQAEPKTTYELNGADKQAMLQRIIQSQDSLKLCHRNDLSKPSPTRPDRTKIYVQDNTHYLAIILCEMAAYQGSFEIVHLQQSSSGLTMKHARLNLAGFPQLDTKTNILSNGYKLTGLGSCIMRTSHVWHQSRLNLLKVDFHEGVKNGCDVFYKPRPDNLITSTSAGVVKIGMSLGELRQILPKETIYEVERLSRMDFPRLKVTYRSKSLSLIVSGFNLSNPSLDDLTDETKIEGIRISHYGFMTAEGIRPGTGIEEAIAAYGPATFSFLPHTEDEEAIYFESKPLSSSKAKKVVNFRPNNRALFSRGNYPNYTGIPSVSQLMEGDENRESLAGLPKTLPLPYSVGKYSRFKSDHPEFPLLETQEYREDLAMDLAIAEIWVSASPDSIRQED